MEDFKYIVQDYFFELGKWHLTPNNVFVTESL